MSTETTQSVTGPTLDAAACSGTVDFESRMIAEANLQTAAVEFAAIWGVDQTAHPRSYWLDRHLECWQELARCAVRYAEAMGESPNAQAEPRREDDKARHYMDGYESQMRQNAEVSEGGTRDSRIETAAQSRPSLH